ncbi:hypothetical protein H0H81_003120 [Sphagnurus paluster]|uniref:RING-type domain-containing protein n=1 Tax=Sphagnurus paluster TaxID=117069 RepID=A0A9P7FNV5_9AGAR|nr:hypothetical protein H0H81_003120 [Sphagnurus paluster]
MSFASWYRFDYTAWTRSRPLPSPAAQPDTRTTPAAPNPNDTPANQKDKKGNDTLFGPNIGVVSSGPPWTATSEKKVLTDELTPEIVSSWVAKSKDTSQPTTTLQALVNLKRPSIRLSPLASDEPEAHHQHGLEFEYDCDAPKCGIYVHVLLPKDHPDAPVTASATGLSKHLIFESVVDGGFGKLLKLEEGAMLELGRFEHIPVDQSSATNLAPPSTEAGDVSQSATASDATPTTTGPTANARNSRRRFTHLHFRRRSQGHSVTGPALAVVDAEPAAATDTKGSKEEPADGVRVTIRLAALDEQGTELASPNEQVTYLHVVRLGVKAEGDTDEDARPWVVKVVKREATIGPHTFHLHEIYGLTSSSAHQHSNNTIPSTANQGHTYPPPATPAEATSTGEDDPSSECLLCLSSPREVVLLPCRHLVACRECALNMVEFGAGGNITQAEEPVVSGGDAGENAAGTDAAAADSAAPADGATATPAPTPAAPTPTTRRKRKAKGWFCPVCRQPYTSLLRITTSPPPPAQEQQGDDKEAVDAAPVAVAPDTNPNEDNTRTGGGILGTSFLRGLNFNRAPAPPGDVESVAGSGRVGS